LFDKGADYLLQVRGMSMRDAGILDGDYLAVKKLPKPEMVRLLLLVSMMK
jgi:SOS-response transcriptional repressor LexA